MRPPGPVIAMTYTGGSLATSLWCTRDEAILPWRRHQPPGERGSPDGLQFRQPVDDQRPSRAADGACSPTRSGGAIKATFGIVRSPPTASVPGSNSSVTIDIGTEYTNGQPTTGTRGVPLLTIVFFLRPANLPPATLSPK